MVIRFDASDFDALARDLDRAAATDLIGKIAPSVSKGALNVKNAMQGDMSKSRHFGQVASAISYDLDTFTNHLRAEIGPESAGRQVGDLAHFAYFGGANGGGGTVPDPEYLLEQEAPALEQFVGDILEGLL